MIGDRAGLDDEVERRLQEAGTYHVIAISGGNIAILAGLIIAGFRLAGLLGRTAMLASIVAAGRVRAPGGWWRVGRSRDVHGRRLLRRQGRRPAQPAAERARVRRGVPAGRAEPLSVADPAFVLTFGATLAILVGRAVAAIAPLSATSRARARRCLLPRPPPRRC